MEVEQGKMESSKLSKTAYQRKRKKADRLRKRKENAAGKAKRIAETRNAFTKIIRNSAARMMLSLTSKTRRKFSVVASSKGGRSMSLRKFVDCVSEFCSSIASIGVYQLVAAE